MNIPVTVLDDMSQVPGITVPSAYLQNILNNQQEYRDKLKQHADDVFNRKICPINLNQEK